MYIGIIIDENLSVEIVKVSRAVCVSIRNIGMIWKHISQPVAEPFTHALITSGLDMCNSLLHSLKKMQLQWFQQLKNTAARLVTLFRKFTRITHILKQLHWLPIKQRIIFKISILVFETIHGVLPTCVTLSNCTTHSVDISALCPSLMCIFCKRYPLLWLSRVCN